MVYLATLLSICKDTITCEKLSCIIALSSKGLCAEISPFVTRGLSQWERSSTLPPIPLWHVGLEGDDRQLSVEMMNCVPEVKSFVHRCRVYLRKAGIWRDTSQSWSEERKCGHNSGCIMRLRACESSRQCSLNSQIPPNVILWIVLNRGGFGLKTLFHVV